MKRTSEGGSPEGGGGTGTGVASFVPVMLTRPFLAGERVAAVVGVTPSGVPVYTSANLLSVGNAVSHLMPPGFDSASVQCDDGILIAACSNGLFVITGFNYTIAFTIRIPFLPEHATLLMTDGVPSACCSKMDSVIYFPAGSEAPTDIRTHTLPGTHVSSVVRDHDRACVDALFTDGSRIRMAAGQIEEMRALEPLATLLGFHTGKELDFIQRANHNVVVLRSGFPMALLPAAGPCRGLLWGTYSAYLLACESDPCPELVAFEYVSMTRLDSVYPDAAAPSLAVAGQECTKAAGQFLLYRGGIYHLAAAV